MSVSFLWWYRLFKNMAEIIVYNSVIAQEKDEFMSTFTLNQKSLY